MEIANLWARVGAASSRPRIAQKSDAGAITELLRWASFGHLHVDWHMPTDWLGTDGFVVQEEADDPTEQPSLTTALFGTGPRLEACLAVAADPPPAAWVRVAAVRDSMRPLAVLGRMLEMIRPYLLQSGANRLAWLPLDDWPTTWLSELGFAPISAIVGFERYGGEIPAVVLPAGVSIRPVRATDMETLAAIEAAAFEPIWRHSAEALRLAQQQSLSFDVAVLDGVPVGFQFSTRGTRGAHLARMTVDPVHQRRGIGAALLARAMESYRRAGLRMMTLNTQVDNYPAQALYRRFGFVSTRQEWPIWGVWLANDNDVENDVE